MSSYKGRVFLAPSGEWAFKFYIDDVEAGGGAGLETEQEAKMACYEVLADYGAASPNIEVVAYAALPPLA